MKSYAVLFLLVLTLPAWSQAKDGQALLQQIDDQVMFTSDYAALLTVNQQKGSEESVTKVALFRRDKASRYYLEVMEPPADKGKKYLKIDDTLWVLDPQSSKLTSTSARERFQGSNAKASDFVRTPLAKDYKIVSSEKTLLGQLPTTVYELVAVRPEVTYYKSKIWVSEDNLVRKTEDYSKEGQLLRTTAIPSYTKIGSKYDPARILILDELKAKVVQGKKVYERTEILVSNQNLKPQPDSIFNLTYLQALAKK